MIEETVDTIITEKKKLAGKPVMLMCDKGDMVKEKEKALVL